MKFKQVRKLFKQQGWELTRQEGSHQQWEKDGQIETIAGKDSDDVPRGLLNKFLKRLGLK